VAPITIALVGVLALPLALSSKNFGDRKSTIIQFLIGLAAGTVALWTSALVFRWLGRLPAWPLPVMLFISLAIYNRDMVSKFAKHPGVSEDVAEGIGNCIGVIIGALMFIKW
jgi:4-hydroxybenzoate polyprenyltransferase